MIGGYFQSLAEADLQDSFIQASPNDNENYNSSNNLVVKEDGGDLTRETFIKFKATKAGSGVIRIVCHILPDIAFTLEAYHTSTDWRETAITWSNAPAAGALSGSINITNLTTPQTIDIPVNVEKIGMVSFKIKTPTNLFNKNGIVFYGKTGATPPKLIIS